MTAPVQFTDTDYVNLDHIISGGDISACSKHDLERFAVMLSRPKAYEHFGSNSFPQICETVRTLILVRMSEDANLQARKESRLALIISCIALLAGIVQAGVSLWPHTSSPIPVHSTPATSIPQTSAAPMPQTPMQAPIVPPSSVSTKGK